MAEKNYNEEFLAFIETNTPELDSFADHIHLRDNVEVNKQIIVCNLTITDKEISELRFSNVTFLDCNFTNVKFISLRLDIVVFANCTFLNSGFYRNLFILCDINHCTFNGVIFNSVEYHLIKQRDTKYLDCMLFSHEYYGGTFDDVEFKSCKFQDLSMRLIVMIANLNIIDSTITYSHYSHFDLTNLTFVDCKLNSNVFTNVRISDSTLNSTKSPENENSCYIDIQSVINNNLNDSTLKFFGIHGSFAKDYLRDLVTEIKFQSVFISYSFEDLEFANILNEQLRLNGVNTFFWQRDAPGGKRLKHIMSDKIQKHDRLLFIASENSLKSEACHYELNEARERQNKEWKDVYYPIHIDDYLFKVRKDDIPRKYRDDFWENIEEVKEFNSKDFSMFKSEADFKTPEFEEAVKELIKDLKL